MILSNTYEKYRYTRFVKKEVDCLHPLLSLTLLTIQSSGYMNVPYAQYIDRKYRCLRDIELKTVRAGSI